MQKTRNIIFTITLHNITCTVIKRICIVISISKKKKKNTTHIHNPIKHVLHCHQEHRFICLFSTPSLFLSCCLQNLFSLRTLRTLLTSTDFAYFFLGKEKAVTLEAAEAYKLLTPTCLSEEWLICLLQHHNQNPRGT